MLIASTKKLEKKSTQSSKEYLLKLINKVNKFNLIQEYINKGKIPRDSSIKIFLIKIYIIYLRYSVELGISLMTFSETCVINMLFFFAFISICNQIIKLILWICTFCLKFIKILIWIYNNYDLIKNQ